MGRARRVVLVIASIVLVWVAVSATKGKTKPIQAAPKPAAVSWQTARPVLPEWAPKNPSPVFLRAAKVLKPLPLETMKSPGRTDAENAARMKGATIMWLAAYEFFGTMSDAQIERFLQANPKYFVMPVKELTKKQRAALDRYFAAWREALKGQAMPGHPELADCLLMLYKDGATRDLSNVLVGFDAGKYQGAGHYVHLCFHVKTTKGTTGGFGSNFAQI